ncbi:MAG: hypothetical protein QOD06_1399, partial [Candidatus Binatota bacterium]|nr:hypothetical protein [Candidatus Binatota bacterium]
ALVASACGRFELVKVIETVRRGEPVRATGVFDCDGFRAPHAGLARY